MTLRHTFASRLLQNRESLVYVKDQLGHHSIKVTVDVYGHLVPGANKAAVDRLDEQVHALEAAIGQGETVPAQAEGPEIARNPTQPPRTQRATERTRGVTDRSVTPREDLVELRGVELEKATLMPPEDQAIPIPPSRRRGERWAR